MFQASFENPPGGFKGTYEKGSIKSVSERFQAWSKSFRSVLRVFQGNLNGVSVFQSFQDFSCMS